MTTTSTELRAFACPQEPLDLSALGRMSQKRSARIIALFRKSMRGPLAARTEGVDSLLQRFCAEPCDFETAWPAAIGLMRLALLTEPRDSDRALEAAVAFALHLGERGYAAKWRCSLARPASFRFARYQLPSVSTLVFESNGRDAQIELGESPKAESLTFSASGRQWNSDRVRALPIVGTGAAPVVLMPRLPDAIPMPDNLVPVDDPDATVAGFEEIYALIGERAAVYAPWVQRAIRALVPVEPPPRTKIGISFEFLPGVSVLSRHTGRVPTVALGEALIHEASHQHYYASTQLGPVHDGSDEALYFSPARGIDRPIDMILLAYHAFANVVLYYRLCQANDAEDAAFCREQEHRLSEWLDELRGPIEKTRALTPLGRALYEPLAERIDKATVIP